MNGGIFTLSREELRRLDSTEAVQAFRELLWAEATALSIAKNLIDVPGSINARDGGIDAKVEGVTVGTGQGIIKAGTTCYQIKAGKFSPTQPANITKILCRPSPNNHELQPKVKTCLDQDGTLVVVLFGNDSPDQTDNQLKNLYISRLSKIDVRYKSATVEVWRQSKLLGFFQRFPSLVLKLKRYDNAPFKFHDSWADEPEMRRRLEVGQHQESLIAEVREVLRRDADGAIHLRVSGAPGIGKTRLILEATRAEDLAPLVIYCQSASVFRDSLLLHQMTRRDNEGRVLLVIDECAAGESAEFWNGLASMGSRLKLITIHHEANPTSGRTVRVEIPRLGDDQVEKIMASYDIPEEQATRFASYCKGSPRAAHVLGQNLAANPEDLLRTPDTVLVWDRWVAGRDDLDSQVVRERRTVLRYLALFKGFGFGPPYGGEARAIAGMIEGADRAITLPKFSEIIQGLRQRKLLQGETTLYIAPDVLHIRLWSEWWDTYGPTIDIVDFVNRLPFELREGFFEMFRYARESEIASRAVERLVGPGGPFWDTELLQTELGGSFFRALTEANPRATLRCLENSIPNWGLERILQFTSGRRQSIEALQLICVWRELFAGAARVLLLLAEGENESWANNATGVFVDLFSPAPGRVAPTEASPEERFPVLKEALLFGTDAQQAIAVQACGSALSTGPFMRMAGPEHQGLRPEAQLWSPRSRQEHIDAYRRVWGLLVEHLGNLPDTTRSEAVSILLRQAQGLVAIPELENLVPNDIGKLVEQGIASDREVVSTAAEILHYHGSGLSPGARSRWEALHASLAEADFHSRLRRYVGTALISDHFDETGERTDRKQSTLAELAEEALNDLALLGPELPWLVTAEAEDGYRFGYELGKRDIESSLLPGLLDAQKGAGIAGSLMLLSGYLCAVSERDAAKCENLFDGLLENKDTAGWVFELVWRSGVVTERTTRVILGLLREGSLDPTDLRMFAYGGRVQDLSQDMFESWVEILVDGPSAEYLSTALVLSRMYEEQTGSSVPDPLLERLLLHSVWFSEVSNSLSSQTDDWAWCELATRLIARKPEARRLLAEKVLMNFGSRGIVSGRRVGSVVKFLARTIDEAPAELWDLISPDLADGDTRTFWIKQWLQGSDSFGLVQNGALELFPTELIWRWVEEDPSERAPILASLVPKDLGADPSYTRELLVRYGNIEGVPVALNGRYANEGWTGPESEHFTKRRDHYLSIRNDESDVRVVSWLDKYIEYLDYMIRRAEIEEEREA
ncbi:hypothetical protein KAU37_06125 [Candidatus Bipolaricaulota bacterium]|nr:hypothetical protein [Candidatus Bipolaricaulota bacterium]